ncbi:DUF6516 family protein [Sinimarinibacterium sp. NLF-5-8]|uniref:toxin-antitoxin system TumE family protein n=1 Tax=Sinimarinibacterium sp. NLF-5-8 TaxID=2698684 RepID=UPI00137BAAC5|nr:DUF6516 family protein [Sinimarinibacterium sp. NLF-5-8]QHS09104.1 hypothetical protein GT972_02350 [Sinimarinibacterium sp. NLF-5-8]
MKAELLIDRRDPVSADAFVELVLWRVSQPVRASAHHYKYRLAYVVSGVCVLRFDNEAGKGDHKHVGNVEFPIVFSDPDQLVADFKAEITRWNHENRHS